jgi:hypothetical protein
MKAALLLLIDSLPYALTTIGALVVVAVNIAPALYYN